jgi:hypothetical protein
MTRAGDNGPGWDLPGYQDALNSNPDAGWVDVKFSGDDEGEDGQPKDGFLDGIARILGLN